MTCIPGSGAITNELLACRLYSDSGGKNQAPNRKKIRLVYQEQSIRSCKQNALCGNLGGYSISK